jgi:hypothetical protein
MSFRIVYFLSRVLLQQKSTLKCLEYNLIGLEVVFQLLWGGDSVLERLSISHIEDDEIAFLSDALENNSNTKLKELDMRDNDMLTVEGWIAFATVLSFPNSYTYAQVKRADEAKLAGSKRAKNQGQGQAQDWSVKRKEDVSSWEKFLGTAYN